MPRTLISSGSYLEPEIGFSRAVRVGQFVAVARTATPIAAAGGTAALGDVYGQTIRCLEIIGKAVAEAGGTMANIIRTWIVLTDISTWRDAARAHGEVFRDIRPACTFVDESFCGCPLEERSVGTAAAAICWSDSAPSHPRGRSSPAR